MHPQLTSIFWCRRHPRRVDRPRNRRSTAPGRSPWQRRWQTKRWLPSRERSIAWMPLDPRSRRSQACTQSTATLVPGQISACISLPTTGRCMSERLSPVSSHAISTHTSVAAERDPRQSGDRWLHCCGTPSDSKESRATAISRSVQRTLVWTTGTKGSWGSGWKVGFSSQSGRSPRTATIWSTWSASYLRAGARRSIFRTTCRRGRQSYSLHAGEWLTMPGAGPMIVVSRSDRLARSCTVLQLACLAD